MRNKEFPDQAFPIDPLSVGGGKPLARTAGPTILRTPNLARFANQSVRSSMSYAAAPLCSPTRSSIFLERQVGVNLIRWNAAGHILELPQIDNDSFVHDLKRAGYSTGYFGKWGLGITTIGAPFYHGFDYYLGPLEHAEPHCVFLPKLFYFNHTLHSLPANEQEILNLQIPYRGNFAQDFSEKNCALNPRASCEYLNDIIRDQMFLYMNEKLSESVPFLMVWAPTYPHAASYNQNAPKPEYLSACKRISPWRINTLAEVYRDHASQIEQHLDGDIGMFLDFLEARPAVDENTFIIFTTDNGAQEDSYGYSVNFFQSTGGLNGHKYQFWEGGIRVPTMVRWKNRFPAGLVSNVPNFVADIGPTFREAAGLDSTLNAMKYGYDHKPGNAYSMFKVWETGNASFAPNRDYIYVEACSKQMGDDNSCEGAFINISSWQNDSSPVYKLILYSNSVTGSLLYDLRADPQELNPITTLPDVVQTMYNKRQEIRAPIQTIWWKELIQAAGLKKKRKRSRRRG